jgi:hypothetical protein
MSVFASKITQGSNLVLQDDSLSQTYFPHEPTPGQIKLQTITDF